MEEDVGGSGHEFRCSAGLLQINGDIDGRGSRADDKHPLALELAQIAMIVAVAHRVVR